MCQASVITNRVERLSKRSYSHRLDVATPNRYHVTQLVRINRELDSLYEFIYDDWRTITEEDYKMFGGQFVILIQTIKQRLSGFTRLVKLELIKNKVSPACT